MSHRDWIRSETYVDAALNLVIGRIGIGVFNSDQQPVWNSKHTIALVMAGEFYDPDRSGGKGDEQLALSYYQEYGETFASRLNGAFVIGILDKRQKKLVIANDRFGLYPIYFSTWGGNLVFAPEVKAILATKIVPKKLDLIALAQYMRFQHLLGLRTFFEDIHLFPAASILSCDLQTGDCETRAYWTFADIPDRLNVTFPEAAEETGMLLRRTVARLTQDQLRPGVFLSGGLDSRTILGLIQRRPVVTHTFGAKGCRDVRYAAQIARTVGSEHHWHDLTDGRWVADHAGFHLELTEGFHSWIHSHGISMLPEVRNTMDVNLTGWDGGTVMGHGDSIGPRISESVDDLALTALLFQRFNQLYTWPGITEAEEGFLYRDEISKRIRGLAYDSFVVEFEHFRKFRKDLRGDLFFIIHHCRRMTQNMITFARSYIEVRFPFFDYDLIEFLYGIPARVRGHRELYRDIIQKELPRLALIPYDNDEFLPTSNSTVRTAHATAVKIVHRLRRNQPQDTLYADYENYLRTDLRAWGEKILFDPRLLKRGIFNPEFVKSIWARHQSRMEEWTVGKIAPIMTYEMMLQRYYD
ncbi:MAG TPA: asparagine synthase-related protein [Anaerolineaceae bacterium]|nr:asparagine synthase-related protein [Anaerolineaceae bacterium]